MNALRAIGATVATFAAISAVSAVAAGAIGWRVARRLERNVAASAPTPAST
jgi:hypothetical protein